MASAAARLLFLCGFRLVVLERREPLAVRRLVCFAQAVFSERAVVEGVEGRLVPAEELSLAEPTFVPVVVDPDGDLLARLRPEAVVDARMAKRNLGTTAADAPLVVGLGPGFVAGQDTHAVVETQRGSCLGRVIWSGSALADTGVPGDVLGHREERVLRAPRAGLFRGRRPIGDVVRAGEAVGEIDGTPVVAEVSGLLRGLLADGVTVFAGTKVGDVDPRGPSVDPAWVSDKARAVAAGVLEAILVGSRP